MQSWFVVGFVRENYQFFELLNLFRILLSCFSFVIRESLFLCVFLKTWWLSLFCFKLVRTSIFLTTTTSSLVYCNQILQ